MIVVVPLCVVTIRVDMVCGYLARIGFPSRLTVFLSPKTMMMSISVKKEDYAAGDNLSK